MIVRGHPHPSIDVFYLTRYEGEHHRSTKAGARKIDELAGEDVEGTDIGGISPQQSVI